MLDPQTLGAVAGVIGATATALGATAGVIAAVTGLVREMRRDPRAKGDASGTPSG